MEENSVNTEAVAESLGAGAESPEGDNDFVRGLFGDDFSTEGSAAESGERDEEEGEEEKKPAEPEEGEEPSEAKEDPAESSEAEKQPEKVSFVEHGKTYNVDKEALERVAAGAGRRPDEFIDLYQKGCGFDALQARYAEAVKDGEIIDGIAKARGTDPAKAREELIYAAETLPVDNLAAEIMERNPDIADSEARRWAQAEIENRRAKEREAQAEKQKEAENSEEARAAKEREAKLREIEAFETAHPEIKASDELPASVVAAFQNGSTLEDAWRAYMAEKQLAELRAENERLKTEAARAEKKRYGAEHSAGSASSGAGAAPADPFISGLFG